MYSMKVISSLVLYIMKFPYKKKIITLDQLTYYESTLTTNHDNVFPTIMGA